MIAAGDKTRYYADKVYLYGLTFFLASQACIFTSSVSALFYNILFYAGAVLLIAAGIYKVFFTLFRDLRKAVTAMAVILFSLAYFLYSGMITGYADAFAYLIVGMAIAGAIDVNADHILFAGIIGNLVMIINNVYVSFTRTDTLSSNAYTDNDFFYFGQNVFTFSKMNNRSTTDWAAHYFWIIAAYLWIRGKKITWGEILAAAALDVLVYSFTGANTSLVCISLAIVITVIYKLSVTLQDRHGDNSIPGAPRKEPVLPDPLRKILDICSKYSFVIFASLMILMTLSYDFGSPIFYRLNLLLHQRLALGQRGIIEHGVHLFASGVPIYGNDSTIDNFYNFLDSSYISVLVRMGLLPFVFYLGSMTAVQIRHKKYLYGAMMLAVCALSCVEEHHLAEIPYNFFVLLLFADIGSAKTDIVPAVPAKKKTGKDYRITIASVTLCVIFTVSSIMLNYPRYTAVKECERLDGKAAEIYLAIQENLDLLAGSGQWQQQTSAMNSAQYGDLLVRPYDFYYVTGKDWTDMIKDPKAHSYYAVPYDGRESNTAYDVTGLLVSDEVKELIGDGSAVIEYDVAAGRVYSVWYSEHPGCHSTQQGRLVFRIGRFDDKDGMEGYSTGEADD